MSRFFEFVAMYRSQLVYLVPSVCVGIQLLWRCLRHKPMTRRYIGHRMLTIAALGCWMALSDVVFAAYERGTVSLPTTFTIVAALFVIAAASQTFVEVRYPEESAS